MKSSTLFLSLVASAAMVVGLPIPSELKHTLIYTKRNALARRQTSTGDVIGAAFIITNEPTGNNVMISTVSSNGRLKFKGAVATGGNGGRVTTDPINAPDPLFSQGAAKVLGNNLFVVNAGSNTLTMFRIDLNNPNILTRVGRPVNTGGEFPMSVAVSPNAPGVCVVNGGEINGVQCFSVDQQRGLTVIPESTRTLGLRLSTPPAGAPGTISHLIFSEDGRKLIASVKGVPPQSGFLATWAVDDDGSLSENFVVSVPGRGGLLPFSMTVMPGRNAILNTDASIGFSIFNFGNNASLTGFAQTLAIPDQNATCWSSFSKKTGNFYLTDIGTSLVTEVTVDENFNAGIVRQYPQGNGVSTIDNDIASIGNKDFLYVLAAGTRTIVVSELQAPGRAQIVQRLALSNSARNANVRLSSAQVQGMTVYISGSSAGNGNGSVIISPDGTVTCNCNCGCGNSTSTSTSTGTGSSRANSTTIIDPYDDPDVEEIDPSVDCNNQGVDNQNQQPTVIVPGDDETVEEEDPNLDPEVIEEDDLPPGIPRVIGAGITSTLAPVVRPPTVTPA